ncbi:VPLPA-CTERM sorting domain-containing protein [Tropicimonas sp. TH_r6]|uniref:VPLPA-CTERM sorting domain-containing protein n=1 Tax=Tropicimonas sp. TH_r6 TaxID=3082085 RepID=UPI002954D3FF|nr:VPLPA-CTERM sorting domain-containing protein [Tropicimonas sp. TH_r6]MDV7143534.1 VPLPA-CTERM sorting domain-containing protein [Tropicimonas sp. TH_r6]
MNLKLLAAAAVVIGALSAQTAVAAITTTVLGTDNLYHVNWGSSNGPAAMTGRGTNVSAVSDSSGAINFAALGPLMSIATGSVVDAGPTATDADGYSSIFNGLRVYSLIGVWSSTSASISAIGDSFFVGKSATLVVPTVASAFLFLGENDGIFTDNSGAYEVTIETSAIPLPASLPLLVFGLGGLGLAARRKRKSA